MYIYRQESGVFSALALAFELLLQSETAWHTRDFFFLNTGKTVAFLVPAFELLLRSESTWRPRDVGAIVIAPTRELAKQILSVSSTMAQHV